MVCPHRTAHQALPELHQPQDIRRRQARELRITLIAVMRQVFLEPLE
jgi:hypothetical protein